jgi:hypothetical protein
MLTLTPNPILTARPAAPRITVGRIKLELRQLPHLDDDRKLSTHGARRTFKDARQIGAAEEAIDHIPDPDEEFRLVIGGRFALYNVVLACLTRAASPIDTLVIATLGFSKRNVDGLCDLIDTGQAGRLDLLCSHYFKGTSRVSYDYAAQAFTSRPQARFLSIRTHAKILAMRFRDGRTVTVESSANLRSCENIEQMILSGSPDVFDFHRRWIGSLFDAAGLGAA